MSHMSKKLRDQQPWIDELRDAVPLTVITSGPLYNFKRVRFDPDNYGVVIINNAAPTDLTTHHRSCALRSGGNECTC